MATRPRAYPLWVLLSLLANGLMLITLGLLLLRDRGSTPATASTGTVQSSPSLQPVASPEPGQRQYLTYGQWVKLLEREAKVVAEKKPDRLAILMGDSLSLWFPPELLPPEHYWLNQGISGETTAGLLQRLNLIDQTQPQTIFLLIGINDLLKGLSDEVLLQNWQQIVTDLRQSHPKSRLVVQSILPHMGETASWEGKERFRLVPNDRIRQLNRQLKTIAQNSGADYLDLHPLFTDERGNLRAEFSTDGLHLSFQGYQTWRSALQIYGQLRPEKPEKTE